MCIVQLKTREKKLVWRTYLHIFTSLVYCIVFYTVYMLLNVLILQCIHKIN